MDWCRELTYERQSERKREGPKQRLSLKWAPLIPDQLTPATLRLQLEVSPPAAFSRLRQLLCISTPLQIRTSGGRMAHVISSFWGGWGKDQPPQDQWGSVSNLYMANTVLKSVRNLFSAVDNSSNNIWPLMPCSISRIMSSSSGRDWICALREVFAWPCAS
jgi:hypothetical protein